MPSTQTDMALRFAQLHRGPTAFVMPDDWGAGSAQILAQLEDATGDPSHPIYDFNAAVERVAAVVEAARARSSSR